MAKNNYKTPEFKMVSLIKNGIMLSLENGENLSETPSSWQGGGAK